MSIRPLDRIGSIKLKLGIAIVIAVGVGAVVSTIGFGLGVPIWLRPVIAVLIALALVSVLARGMTSPLREMAAAARRMAQGDWSQRVTDTSADEVGELARAFNAMAAQLAEVDRNRKDLIANVSHELRTPISALHARLENLVDGVEEPDEALLRSMLDQAKRLGRLVTQLLDLSRLESGTLELRREMADAGSLLEAVAAEARLQAPHRDIDVSVTPSDLRLYADPDRVHQVMSNLTINALRYGQDASPVTLAAKATPNGVVLSVADEGPGIPIDESDRVFERFYTSEGDGLGLSIAKWIVELHGGDIRATRNEPSGCVMLVRLPSDAR